MHNNIILCIRARTLVILLEYELVVRKLLLLASTSYGYYLERSY